MFWRFGTYHNPSNIDTIIDKGDFQLEDILDESGLIEEIKQHNGKLMEYLRDPKVLEKLLDYVVAPKLEPVAAPEDNEDDDESRGKGISLPFTRPRALSQATDIDDGAGEKKRNRYAFLAAEILSSDNYSIIEALIESRGLLGNFWQFLKRPTPLDPLQASYFTKVNESLFDKKTEEMLDLLKSLDNAVPDMLKHVDCPMIMDLLLRIISLERTEAGQGIVEWLYTQNVMPTLLSFLGPEHSWSTQTSAGDFMKAIITVSANASQNEQTCIGPNELTRQLVSKPCVEQLIQYMLGGGNPLTCGVGIVIEVIRKNNSDYDPDAAEPNAAPSCRDPIYLGTLLRLFAQHIPDFMNLIMNAPANKDKLNSTFGERIEPLGFDRFKTCELMAELLHCSNMGLLNEVGSEELIAARDTQRQALRAQGKLLPMRVDEAPSSTDDLTMRMSQSSPVEEIRRLEVTNSSADDDGFEEVTHNGDEDSSHGVEELPEVSVQGSGSSILDKDEDDFVDEPLSSPRLNFREVDDPNPAQPQQIAGQLPVVLPLLPTEKAAEAPVDPVPLKSSQAGDSDVPVSGAVSQDILSEQQSSGAQKDRSVADKQPESAPSDDNVLPVLDTSVSQTEPLKLTEPADKIAAVKPASPETMSPHPEDTPAPLFSRTSTSGPGPSTISEEATSVSSPPPTSAAEPRAQGNSESSTTPLPEAEEVSIIVQHVSAPTTPIEDDSPTGPQLVVGDYLKKQFVDHRVVPTILGFFFTYPWNNFLHNVVYDIVQQVFNGPMERGYNPTLAISLFESADITNLIINGQLASEKSQAQSKTRMGYMGHLTLIAEEVVKFTERHPAEVLGEVVMEKVMAQDWINYVEGALAETRERDNAVLGGVRPEVAMNNRAGASGLAGVGLSGLGSLGIGGGGGSSALAEAGLNGGQDLSDNSGGNGIGPFAISAGTLMSGFGSSSDEDEDEEQDNEEDVNNEFRAYTDPLNASSNNSMNPPSIPPPPPPPPPLNTGPSRARLQLAARLAMNKRNAAAAANGGQEGSSPTADDATGSGTFSLPSVTASERLRNPFADDEDDDNGSNGSGSGSDDDMDEGGAGGEGASSSSGWNRGSWWRGMVRGARKSSGKKEADKSDDTGIERFGDGRDDSSDSDGRADEDEVDEDIDDEEFGDFAMPEVEGGSGTRKDGTGISSGAPGGGGLITGIDPSREKFLLKPLPVHPSGVKAGSSPFGGLWPFSGPGFGLNQKERKEKDENADSSSSAVGGDKNAEGEKEKITEEPVDIQKEEDTEVPVLGEDGKKINRAVEAKRRTSIEDPDEDDEVVVGDEMISGRGVGMR